MEEIHDERIELQRLKNIRLAFIIQSAGIIGILLFQLITAGPLGLIKNPLWILFILITIILNYQNLKIADELEDETTNPGPYYRVILYAMTFAVIMGILANFFPGDKPANAFLVGLIVFICFLIPFSIVHYLLKKRYVKEIK